MASDDDIDLSDIPEAELEGFLRFREKVDGTNISSQTLLATDYLNHFNEIVMLLEMIPSMPEIIEEAKAWEPRSYQEHFRDSSFSDAELAVEAYDHVPSKFRQPFEDVVATMNKLVPQSLERIDAAVQAGDTDAAAAAAQDATQRLHTLMERASAIIHGSTRALEQDEIDSLLGY